MLLRWTSSRRRQWPRPGPQPLRSASTTTSLAAQDLMGLPNPPQPTVCKHRSSPSPPPSPRPAGRLRRHPPTLAAHPRAMHATRRAGQRPTPFVPLVRRTRLWSALKRSALEVRQGGLDMPRLLRELARARPRAAATEQASGDLGRRAGRHLGSCAASAALQEDFQAIVNDLLQQRGKAGCTLWLVNGSPQQVTWRWPARAGVGAAFAAIPPPPAGTRVSILSDAGALAGWPGAACAWARFTRRLAQHGAQPGRCGRRWRRHRSRSSWRGGRTSSACRRGAGCGASVGASPTTSSGVPKPRVWRRCASGCSRAWPSACASNRRCYVPCAESLRPPPANRGWKRWSGATNRWSTTAAFRAPSPPSILSSIARRLAN